MRSVSKKCAGHTNRNGVSRNLDLSLRKMSESLTALGSQKAIYNRLLKKKSYCSHIRNARACDVNPIKIIKKNLSGKLIHRGNLRENERVCM